MICPKCRNEVSGKWCKYCGAQMETDVFDISPFDDTAGYPNDEKIKDNNKKSIYTLIAIIIVLTIIIITITAVFSVKLQNAKETDGTVQSSAQTEETDYKALLDKATRYMDAGNYTSAEQICKEIIDSHSEDKAELLYKILYNYNNAVSELADYKHKAARKFFDKIPEEYTDYSICDDVDELDNDITKMQVAYEIFDNITAFMDSKNYADAYNEIKIIDSDMLSTDDCEILEEYKTEISENYPPETKEKSDKKNSDISLHDAEDLIRGYCDALVTSIKSHDFDIVAKYMPADSPLYKKQKNTVNTYINENTLKTLDALHINTVSKASDNKWHAEVQEDETLYYSNGVKEHYKHTRTYTIEYIDSAFYITDMK